MSDIVGSSWGQYLLRSSWAWDNIHSELVTVSLEKVDVPISPDDLLNPDITPEQKGEILEYFNKVLQAHQAFSIRADRLYKILRTDESKIKKGILTLHMEPICDFDSEGNAIPLKEE